MMIYDTIPELSSSSVALGFFDGLHPGHMAVIQEAVRSAGNSHAAVISIGGPRRMASRLLTDEDRNTILEAAGVDDLIIPDFDNIRNMDGDEFIREVLVNRLHAARAVCGYNFRFGRGASCDAERLYGICGALDVKCTVVPQVTCEAEEISSRRLRALLDEGSAAEYSRLMGRRYSYSLEVVSGHRLGRRLGFPTVNQNLPEYLHLPRYGVYASVVQTPDGVVRPAVTNIGVRPTVGSPEPLSETWIMDYDADLYGKKLRVELVDFIRPEKRFDSLDELRSAIERDALQAAAITAGICCTDLP